MSVAIPFMSHDLNFSSTDSGLLLSAFFWSYVLFQLPGGWLVDKFGPRITFVFSSLGWGLATAACGLANSVGALVGFRFALGAVEAPCYPASSSTVTRWFPRQERSFVAATFNNGSKIGGIQNMAANLAGIISPILIGVLMQFTHSFTIPLVLAGIVGLIGALIYGFWLPAVQPMQHKAA